MGLAIVGCIIAKFTPTKEAKIGNNGISNLPITEWLSGKVEIKKITFTIQEKVTEVREVAVREYRNYPQSELQELAREMVGDDTQYSCLDNIVTRESGWRIDAVNATSGAAGLFQKISGFDDNYRIDDYQSQLEWGINYMKNRYGSPCEAWSFWLNHNWY